MRRAILAVLVLAAAQAQAEPPVQENDPWTDASLYRGAWGVPHVRAATLHAMAYAFGYAQAEDQLVNVLRAYRMANGRAAEVWGEAYADHDALALQLQHANLAEAAFDEVSEAVREICTGFAMGVNAWMVEHPDAVPDWAHGVRPHEPLALLHLFLTAQAPLHLDAPPPKVPTAETGNAWAVAASKNPSGHTLLAASPHAYYDGPFHWYEAHLAGPEYDVYGATLCGLPLILMGHNRNLAWALTPNQSSFADVYADFSPRMRPEPGSVYTPRPQLHPDVMALAYLSGHVEQYLVKGEDGFEPRYVPVHLRPEGPLIALRGAGAYMWRIAGHGDFGALQQLLDMGRAEDVEAFHAALAQRRLPCFHVIWADGAGDIAYLYNTSAPARRPVAADAAPPRRPLQPYEWRGMSREPVPFENLPLIVSPASGFVQACGNPPALATVGTTPAGVLPPGVALDRDAFRAKRARQLLESPKISFHDAQAMLFDVYAPLAAAALPRLQQVAGRRAVAAIHPDAGALLALLAGWDARATPSSTAMTAFHLWWSFFVVRAQDVQPDAAALYPMLEADDPRLDAAMVEALGDAARLLRNEFGTLEALWGEVHRLHRGDRSEPVGGALSGEPLFLMSDRHQAHQEWPALYGPGFMMAVELSDPPRAVTIVPFGTSADPASPHFDDQMDLFLDGRMKTAWFTAEAVRRNAVYGRGTTLSFAPPGWAGGISLSAPEAVSVQSTTELAPPAPLPDGLAAFSVYAHLTVEPADALVDVYVSIAAPDTFSGGREAQLWVYAAEDGWHPVPASTSAVATATGITGAVVVALLGPEEGRAIASYEPPTLPDMPEITPSVPQSVLVPARPSSPAPAATPEERPRVVITEPPRDAPTRRAAPQPRRQLSPQALQQMRWGEEILLDAPWGAVVIVKPARQLGARIVHEAPENAGLPKGLALYTPILRIEHTGAANAAADVVLSVPVAAGVCSDDALRRAALYVHVPGTGWTRMQGQRLNPAARTFNALDTRLRTYAVLGPAEDRQVAPRTPGQ